MYICRVLDLLDSSQQVELDFDFCLERTKPQLFAHENSIHFPLPDSDPLNEQVIFFLFPFTFLPFLPCPYCKSMLILHHLAQHNCFHLNMRLVSTHFKFKMADQAFCSIAYHERQGNGHTGKFRSS